MMCKDVFSAAPDEYTLKLVYLYNFTKFINWPPAEQGEHEEPYKICIMGSIPASNALKQLEQKRSKNRLITTSRRSVDQNADDCHILFITKNISRSDVSRVLASPLENTVIVGETNAFAKQAGDIGFVIDDNNHVTIEINLNNTQNKNVNIRAPLLEIARKVYRAEEQE
ncbi:hypothetical protein Kalk_01915 [Ketobacter alkanivorans]|uniref:DUF4154 domain-containing protein n=2 Tax=Ketobacter alkanivorans TaxID=1917421 RepID=A0A2K9LG96_9GAMM|nr:hypothetical protein Kalk_01915 [Ketobacter alkanivorans]